jgi:glyoxalase family protein
VTAIASDPQKNVDFYTQALGLRLIKQTVNFDAPHIWHLYYGDQAGTPSSILTFFPWPGVVRGKEGAGLVTATSFSVPSESIGFWQQRFAKLGIETESSYSNGAEDIIVIRDPDGMQLELVGTQGDHRSGWDGVASIPMEHAVRGLHAVTLEQFQLDPTAGMLTELLGMQLGSESKNSAVFEMDDGLSGALVNVAAGIDKKGLQAGGTVHHVAFRSPDIQTMTLWQQELSSKGVLVTEIMDRQYFKSIYFREPGGVLFEIATDTPGFDIDEPLLELGKKLQLPPWLEPTREQIESVLTPFELKQGEYAS